MSMIRRTTLFGRAMTDLRIKSGYTTNGLAKAMGMSKGQISHYEVGRRYPLTEGWLLLRRIFKLKPEELVKLMELALQAKTKGKAKDAGAGQP